MVNRRPYRGKLEVTLRVLMIGLQLFHILDLNIRIAAQYTFSILALYLHFSIQTHLCALQTYWLKPYDIGLIWSVNKNSMVFKPTDKNVIVITGGKYIFALVESIYLGEVVTWVKKDQLDVLSGLKNLGCC